MPFRNQKQDQKSHKFSCRTTLILALVFLDASFCTAQSFSFLNRAYNPRISSLAGTTTAQYGDAGSVFQNPAGLVFIQDDQLNICYTNHLLDMKGGLVSMAIPQRWGNLCLGLIFFDYGEFNEINSYGITSGETFSARDMAVAISYSNLLTDRFSYGISAKYIHSKLAHYKADAIAIDLGLIYRLTFFRRTTIGLSILNVGKNFNYYYFVEERLPSTISFGASHRLSMWPVSINFTYKHHFDENRKNSGNAMMFCFGTEFSVLENLQCRIGYDFQKKEALALTSRDNLAGLSFGFGLMLGSNSLDYSYCDYGALGFVHHIGYTFNLHGQKMMAIDSQITRATEIVPTKPPGKISHKITADAVIISWEKRENTTYNLYARRNEKARWIKMTENPIQSDRIVLNKPRRKGKYYFALSAVYQNVESELSAPIIIDIK